MTSAPIRPGLELEVEAYDGFEGAGVFLDCEVVLADKRSMHLLNLV